MNSTLRFNIPDNQCFNFSRMYISYTITPEIKPAPKVIRTRPDPRKVFNSVIERMNKKNEQSFERVDDCLCDCYCGHPGQCPCDEEDYCIGNHVASYELIRYSINLIYGIMDYKDRIRMKENRKETGRIEREKQKQFDREIEDLKKKGHKFISIPAEIVYK